MGNIFTLDMLRAEAEKEFASVEIAVGEDVIVLNNLLRISKADREVAGGKLDELTALYNTEGVKADLLAEKMREVIVAVASDGKGQLLVDALGEDVALVMGVFKHWSGMAEVGEAENSPE